MGDPRYRAGAPYNVGTCTAYGVSTRNICSWPRSQHTDPFSSSTPAQQASTVARTTARSRATATPQILTAALATMPTCTNRTLGCMVRRRCPSSIASWPQAVVEVVATVAVKPQRQQCAPRRRLLQTLATPVVAAAEAVRAQPSTGSVVVKAGTDQRVAQAVARARASDSITRSVCEKGN